MSNDLTNITAEDQAILKNKQVIAVNRESVAIAVDDYMISLRYFVLRMYLSMVW